MSLNSRLRTCEASGKTTTCGPRASPVPLTPHPRLRPVPMAVTYHLPLLREHRWTPITHATYAASSWLSPSSSNSRAYALCLLTSTTCSRPSATATYKRQLSTTLTCIYDMLTDIAGLMSPQSTNARGAKPNPTRTRNLIMNLRLVINHRLSSPPPPPTWCYGGGISSPHRQLPTVQRTNFVINQHRHRRQVLPAQPQHPQHRHRRHVLPER
jgi:hypothetical protein